MKTAITSLCVLCLSIICARQACAQQGQKSREAPRWRQRRWTVSASFGGASPVGRFAGKNIYDSTAAFAKTGTVFNISGAYRITGHFGVTALLSGQKNTVNNKAIVSDLETAFTNHAYTVDDQPWKAGRAMGGAYMQWPLGPKGRFSLTISALAGALMVDLPDRKIADVFTSQGQYNDETMELSYKVEKWQFGYQGGAALNFSITRHFWIKASVDYAGARLKIPDPPQVLASKSSPGALFSLYPPGIPAFLIGSSPTGVYAFPAPPHYVQPLATVNTCLGVGFSF